MSLIKWSPIRTLSNEYVDNNPYFEMNNLIKYIFDDTLDYIEDLFNKIRDSSLLFLLRSHIGSSACSEFSPKDRERNMSAQVEPPPVKTQKCANPMQEGYVHLPCMQNEGGACTTNSISTGAERTEQRTDLLAVKHEPHLNGLSLA